MPGRSSGRRSSGSRHVDLQETRATPRTAAADPFASGVGLTLGVDLQRRTHAGAGRCRSGSAARFSPTAANTRGNASSSSTSRTLIRRPLSRSTSQYALTPSALAAGTTSSRTCEIPASRSSGDSFSKKSLELSCERSSHGLAWARCSSLRQRSGACAPRRRGHALLRDRSGRGWARTAQRLEEDRPEAVLHVGIAGSRTLEPLTVVLGSIAVYEDLRAAIPSSITSSRMKNCCTCARLAPRRTCPADRHVGRRRRDDEVRGRGDGRLRSAARLRARGSPGSRAARHRELARRAGSHEVAVRGRARRPCSDARPTRRLLGTRRCRAGSARRTRGRESPRRLVARWSGVPWWTTTTPPGSTSTRSYGSPRSIVSVPLSGTKTSS